MGRTLLNDFPLWLLAVGSIVAPGALAFGGAVLARKLFPRLAGTDFRETGSAVLPATLAVYGIVLAFVIVNQYTDFSAVRDDVQSEALNLEDLHRAAQGFSQPTHSRLDAVLTDYVRTVGLQEWDDLAHGRDSPRAAYDFDLLYATLVSYKPTEPATVALYQEALGFLHDAHVGRHRRVDAAIDTLPSVLVWFLILGTVATVAASYMLGLGRRHHFIVPVSLACLLGFTLLLSMKLDYPFSGSDKIPTRHFTEGALAPLFYNGQGNVLGPPPKAR
ncbi:MAG: DUF4239 domain-containing protein [Actinomycetota bacterium]|nr:DUF4239 domain-containing protein [Actinomycetota bacterium]